MCQKWVKSAGWPNFAGFKAFFPLRLVITKLVMCKGWSTLQRSRVGVRRVRVRVKGFTGVLQGILFL